MDGAGGSCEGVGVCVGETWGGGEGENLVTVLGGSGSCVEEVIMGGVGEGEGEVEEGRGTLM